MLIRIHETEQPDVWKGLPERHVQRQLLDLQAGMRRPAGWWLTEAQSEESPPSDEESPFACPIEAAGSDCEQDSDDELLPPDAQGSAEVDEESLEVNPRTHKSVSIISLGFIAFLF